MACAGGLQRLSITFYDGRTNKKKLRHHQMVRVGSATSRKTISGLRGYIIK